jgi:hypothetical protein
LIRGTGHVLGAASDWISKGPLQSILSGHDVDCTRGPSQTIILQFATFRQQLQVNCPDPSTLKILFDALYVLENIFTEVLCSQGHKQNKDPGIGWKWPQLISGEYSTLLREQHHGALVVFAYFSLLSDNWSYVWYLRGWPARSVQAVSKHIDPAWRECMRWPEEQIRDGFPIFKTEEGGEEGALPKTPLSN